MGFAIALAIGIGVGYLILRNPSVLSSLTSSAQSAIGNVLHSPATVTIGGSPAPDGWAPGITQQAGSAASLAGTAIGTTGSLANAASSGAFAATSLGSALPIIGAAVGIVSTVIGMISAHHKAAVAHEAALLNNSVGHTLQTFVLIIQGVVTGEFTSSSQTDPLIQQAINDYYSLVSGGGSGAIEGRWPVTKFPFDLNENSRKPSVCNGPCVVGHFNIEGTAAAARLAIALILSNGSGGGPTGSGTPINQYPAGFNIVNGHGTFYIYQVGSHAGFNGYPEVDMTW